MIIGIGTDIIEVDRVKKHVEAGFGFKEKVFTQREIEYCEAKFNKAQNFAARFSAKEAFLKAIGTGLRHGLSFLDIEIINDDLGKPEIILHGKAQEIAQKIGTTNIQVSLTHLKDVVNAIVILEK
ncbi:MAG: holo-ACP synthase [Bacteroidales bacterium]|nr:holo-ACP synthase [Bacteroidales bacterium]